MDDVDVPHSERQLGKICTPIFNAGDELIVVEYQVRTSAFHRANSTRC